MIQLLSSHMRGGGGGMGSHVPSSIPLPEVEQHNVHNNVFAHGTVTNYRRRSTTMCHDQRAWPIGPN